MYCAVGLSAMGTVRFKYDSGNYIAWSGALSVSDQKGLKEMTVYSKDRIVWKLTCGMEIDL